jgi:hypothetical protein
LVFPIFRNRNKHAKLKDKIILVGYHGTGINTTVKALEILGKKVWKKPVDPKSGLFDKSNKKLESKFAPYDVFAGLPFSNHYKNFKDIFDDKCKIILTVRDPLDWYSEILSANKSKNEHILEQVFSDMEALKKSQKKKKAIQNYMDHNMEVIDFFAEKDEDILILEYGKHNKWKRICDFLDIDIPEDKYPKMKDDFKKSIFSLKSPLLF